MEKMHLKDEKGTVKVSSKIKDETGDDWNDS